MTGEDHGKAGKTRMKQRLWSIFNNESALGRAMNVCGIVIAANIMFVLVSMPVVTAGPAFAAMYHVMLRFLRSDGEINPFKEFWIGLKNNFRQAIIVWLLFLVIVIIGVMDIRFAMYAKGVMTIFKYLIYLIFGIALILVSHMAPVMAAFADSIPHLARNSVYFASKNPIRALGIAALNIGPIILTYYDLQRLPLYAFMWAVFGFGAIAMIISKMLIKDFNVYLPELDEFGYPVEKDQE